MPPERDQEVLTGSPGLLIVCLISPCGNQGLGVFQFPADEVVGGALGPLLRRWWEKVWHGRVVGKSR